MPLLFSSSWRWSVMTSWAKSNVLKLSSSSSLKTIHRVTAWCKVHASNTYTHTASHWLWWGWWWWWW
jgi:hypothetical protein